MREGGGEGEGGYFNKTNYRYHQQNNEEKDKSYGPLLFVLDKETNNQPTTKRDVTVSKN